MATYPDPTTKHKLAEDCRRCPALVADRECISWGNGPLDADVMVVGEAPGAGTPNADRWQGGNWTGLAYTSGHSGRTIRDLLAEAGYLNPYFTNAVKCFPADGEGSNREPTADERANCRPYLRSEIETIEPVVVVPTGKHATKSLFTLEGIKLDSFLETVLTPVECPTLGVTALPLLHPSYQNIWIPRLGHTPESYRDALSQHLDTLTQRQS